MLLEVMTAILSWLLGFFGDVASWAKCLAMLELESRSSFFSFSRLLFVA